MLMPPVHLVETHWKPQEMLAILKLNLTNFRFLLNELYYELTSLFHYFYDHLFFGELNIVINDIQFHYMSLWMCDRDRERHSVNESWMTAESIWTLVHPSCRHQSVFNLSGNGVRLRKQFALLCFCNNQKLLLLQQTYSKLLTLIQVECFLRKSFILFDMFLSLCCPVLVCKTIYCSIIWANGFAFRDGQPHNWRWLDIFCFWSNSL